MNLYSVYTLINPQNNNIFYVGVTKYSLEARLSAHISNTYKSNYPVYKYMRTIPVKPIIRELEICSSLKECLSKELYWISEFSKQGKVLYNSIGNNKIPEDIKLIKPVPETYSTAKIPEKIHTELKVYCATNKENLIDFVGVAILEKLKIEGHKFLDKKLK